jgi:CDP-glycerol glycerophosphotransferase
MAAVPQVSVIVPIYNVEAYLEDCLRSVTAQTFRDLEVVLVDDGSTDGSAAIAERFAEQDSRLRIVRQANGGLGHARNTGVKAATGELLSFLDSDDRLPADALELLVDALERGGSDFATGNVHRFTATRTWPAPFLRKAFLRRRGRTHISRFRWLLSDRMAQNKLWRRSFWDAHALAFPEGVLHEDIPVVIPAHFRARSVEVLSKPVYLYRVREGEGEPSITQRRTELRTLNDRFDAVERTRAFLVRHGPYGSRRWYDRCAVAEDLRYHLDVLPEGDGAYREAFLARAIAYLERAGASVEDGLAPVQRLKWRHVRDGRLPELLELLERERAGLPVDRAWRARHRASQAVTLLRPARAPRRPDQRLPRPYNSFTSRPRSFEVPAL